MAGRVGVRDDEPNQQQVECHTPQAVHHVQAAEHLVSQYPVWISRKEGSFLSALHWKVYIILYNGILSLRLVMGFLDPSPTTPERLQLCNDTNNPILIDIRCGYNTKSCRSMTNDTSHCLDQNCEYIAIDLLLEGNRVTWSSRVLNQRMCTNEMSILLYEI